MNELKVRKLTKKENKFLRKTSQMACKRPSQFLKWYNSLTGTEKEFLAHVEENAHLNPHLFDFSKHEQIKAQLEKEYEEDFR